MDLPQDVAQETRAFCSQQAIEAGEPLYGTATQTEAYFLLEYNGTWHPKGLPAADLPQVLKDKLKAIPNSKAQLIRSLSGVLEQGISFYVAQAAEQAPVLFHFLLNRYEEVLDIDLEGVLAGARQYAGNVLGQPLFLTCTHGRRDPCCAKFGRPVYIHLLETLPERGGRQIWQTSHLGGHRFAANLLCLPHGLLLGRLRPENAQLVVGAYLQGQIDLEHYRGRSVYPPPVQAAEYFLRRDQNLLALDALRLLDFVALGERLWRVRFTDTESGEVHTLHIAEQVGQEQVSTSCQPWELEPYTYFMLA